MKYVWQKVIDIEDMQRWPNKAITKNLKKQWKEWKRKKVCVSVYVYGYNKNSRKLFWNKIFLFKLTKERRKTNTQN